MTRVEKKCLLASTGLHAFLLLLIAFWSALFVAKEKPLNQPRIRVVPSRWVESALAGGGGNPKIAYREEDVQKGQTLAPTPPPAAPATPVTPPKAVEATPPPPPPPTPPTPRKAEKPEKIVEPPKAEPIKKITKPVDIPKPKVPDKTAEKVTPKYKIDLTELQPVTAKDREKEKEREKERERQLKAEADAREARENAQRINAARARLAKELGQTAEALQRGFHNGTTVDVGGPGGEAFADYGALVQAAYDDAWKILPDLSNEDFATVVRVTISRDGRVTSSQIIRRSGSASMDKSVQRALDKVRGTGLPAFPNFIKDAERTFTIEFNLKTRRLLG